jgi:hypothetical protein
MLVIGLYGCYSSRILFIHAQDFRMIIRHNLPNKAFTKLDRHVFTNRWLSDGAVRLYGYLCGLRNGANFSDKYIIQALAITQRTLTSRKKELKDQKLILVDQVGPRIYVIYIGHSKMSAATVRAQWKKEEDENKQAKILELANAK